MPIPERRISKIEGEVFHLTAVDALRRQLALPPSGLRPNLPDSPFSIDYLLGFH